MEIQFSEDGMKEFIQDCMEIDDEWKFKKIGSTTGNLEEKYGTFYLIHKKLNNNINLCKCNCKPTLLVMAGISKKSFCNSGKIVIENIDKVQDMFDSVYILCYGEKIKDKQIESCKNRDKQCQQCGIVYPYKDNPEYKEIYKYEEVFAEEVANIIDKIVRKLEITNVIAMGKCAGGGIAIKLVTLNNNYKGLYLAVPASPFDVESLKKIDPQRLKRMTFRFAWNDNDNFEFHWTTNKKKSSRTSKEEIARYDEAMRKMSIYNYKSKIFKNGNEHEINPNFFDKNFLLK